LSAALIDPPRIAPFIMKIGESIQIIADGDPLFECTSCEEALFDLMCCYYVFNFKYSPEVGPALHFIQSEVMKMPDDATAKSLSVLLPLLNNLKVNSVK
jgi:hypothetical protein